MKKFIMFHGRECPHCHVMMPLVERLEREEGIVLEKIEVWHDQANAELMQSHKKVLMSCCGGRLLVPTFLNTENGDAFCGEVPYEKLKSWAGK